MIKYSNNQLLLTQELCIPNKLQNTRYFIEFRLDHIFIDRSFR